MENVRDAVLAYAKKIVDKKWNETVVAKKIDELKDLVSESSFYPKKEEVKKTTNPWIIVLAILGGIAVIAGIAYAVYYFLIPEDSEDFEDLDDFEEDLEDDLEGDE